MLIGQSGARGVTESFDMVNNTFASTRVIYDITVSQSRLRRALMVEDLAVQKRGKEKKNVSTLEGLTWLADVNMRPKYRSVRVSACRVNYIVRIVSIRTLAITR